MSNDTAPLVTGENISPNGPTDACFWCRSTVGTAHKDDCPCWRKKVWVRAVIEYEVEVPHHWDKEMIEFARNDGTWCSGNMLDELEKFHDDLQNRDDVWMGCLCGYTHFTVIERGPLDMLEEMKIRDGRTDAAE